MKVVVILISFLSCLYAHAQISQRMECSIGQGSCIKDSCFENIKVSKNRIQYAFQHMLLEVLAIPVQAKPVVDIDIYHLNDTEFNASWDAGEHHLEMTSDNGRNYSGMLTLEQDFEMEITCNRTEVFLGY